MRRVVVTGLGAITPIGNTCLLYTSGLDEIKAGDKIIMAGFGAGLSYGATYLEF